MSTSTTYDVSISRHSRATRVLHAGLAIAILIQLATSLAMQGPDDEQPGNFLFQLHRYFGGMATVFAFALWVTILLRMRGTALGALIPWFSGRRRSALWRDAKRNVSALLRMRLLAHDADAALPSAVHGLGLMLISAMAVSGSLYFLEVALGLHSAEPDGMIVMTVHLALANLVWAYLIAHAGLALLHQLFRSMSLSTMWSLGR